MKAMFCDMYNHRITGDIACGLNANSNTSAGHAGPSILILNDQGGDVMNTDPSITSTLRAQDHGHPPVVCYALEGNGARPSHMGKGFNGDGKMYTLNTIEQHSVCYAIENHAMDSRVTLTTDGIVQTLNARMGTGGGNVPMVLIGECYAVDSHPMDSRIQIAGDVSPSITAKLAKQASDGPLVLIKENT